MISQAPSGLWLPSSAASTLRRIGVRRCLQCAHNASATAMASLEQRSWSWLGAGKTARGRFGATRDVLDFDMHGPYPFWTFFALAALPYLILQCSNLVPTLDESLPEAPPAPTVENVSHSARKSRFQRAHAALSAPASAAAWASEQGPRQTDQSGAAGRRCAWRVHLGRARSAARRRPDRDRRHLRRLGGSGQRGDARRRSHPRR